MLNIKALAVTAAVVWGAVLFLTGLANQIWSGYGVGLLDVIASLYPGYHGPGGFGSVIVVTLYGVADGLVGGAVFAWLYNTIRGKVASA